MNKRAIENINDEITSLAHSIGWHKPVYVNQANIQDGNSGSATWAEDEIAIVVPYQLDEDDALRQAKLQLIHALSHDPKYTVSGRDASHPVEEAMTYIRGKQIAEQLGLGAEYQKLGNHYIAMDLATAVAEKKGLDGYTDEDLQKAKNYVDRRGLEAGIKKLKEFVPEGKYPLGYEGEKNGLLFKKAKGMVVPAIRASGIGAMGVMLGKGLGRKKRRRRGSGSSGGEELQEVRVNE